MAPTLRFLIPSLVGVAMFLIPYPTGAGANIGIGILTDWAKAALGPLLPPIVVGAVALSALFSLYAWAARPQWATRQGGLGALFSVGPLMVATRVLGAVLALMVLLQRGPEWVTSADTGGVILNDLMTVIFVLFLFASVLLPFLTDFGLMEFIGTLARPVFRPLFRLPGRAAVDAAASWFGSSVVGIIITLQEFEEGYYTKQEAAIIATAFSVVSVAFTVVVLNFVGLGEYFVPFYGAIVLSGRWRPSSCPESPHSPERRPGRSTPPRATRVTPWGTQPEPQPQPQLETQGAQPRTQKEATSGLQILGAPARGPAAGPRTSSPDSHSRGARAWRAPHDVRHLVRPGAAGDGDRDPVPRRRGLHARVHVAIGFRWCHSWKR